MNATMSLESVKHYPVMLDTVLSIISPQHGGMFIDCTFGGGGYTKEILKFSNTQVIGIDRDALSEQYAKKIAKQFPNRFKFFQNKFSNLKEITKLNDNPRAIIFDLGLSSFQIADSKRGFSFKSKGPLNMEMGRNSCSVYGVVNKLDVKDLTKIIKVLGEEKDGRKIANQIIKTRSKKPIQHTYELVSIIKNVKKDYKKFKRDPATKTFQALRIFVNKELTELINGLCEATSLLKEDGILVVVNFHSLEDKIVKGFFKFYSNSNQNPSRYIPKNNISKNSDLFKRTIKKPLKPDENEISNNIRSRSAKLRFAVRNNNLIFTWKEIKRKFEDYLKIEEIRV